MRVPDPSAALPGHEIHVQDFDLARALLVRLYGTVTVDLRRGSAGRFGWRVKPFSIGPATVVVGVVETGMSVSTGEGPRYVLGTARRGSYGVLCEGTGFAAAAGETGFLAGPGMDLTVRTPEDTQTLNISIDPNALASHLAALVGAPVATPPRFAPRVDLRGRAGVDIARLAGLLREASEDPDSPLGSPHVLGHLREALFGVLLLGLESTASHRLRKLPPRTDRRAVKQLEEYLSAHAAEPLSIAALAERNGIGLRSLERSFKAVHGCSIRAFLQAQRLDLARRRLAAAEPGTTVTQVLHASGFGHAGEFSLAYRRHFGESPSETLRRAR